MDPKSPSPKLCNISRACDHSTKKKMLAVILKTLEEISEQIHGYFDPVGTLKVPIGFLYHKVCSGKHQKEYSIIDLRCVILINAI